MSLPFFVDINSYVHDAVAAATFVSWDYCLTVGEEIEYIWRLKWTRVTALFMIIRYIPIIYSNLIMANNIAPFVSASHGTCGAWLVITVICGMAVVVSFEILLSMRVFALYGQNRLVRNGLITLLSCVNVVRIVLLAITIPEYRFGTYISSNILRECYITKYPSVNQSGPYIIEILPEAVLVCLAVVQLVQTKRTQNIAVSNLLVVIVRDGTWAFALVFAIVVWNILQFELAPQNTDKAIIWIAPVLGFTGSRLILNLRSEARLPPGGTNVETWELSFPPIESCSCAHELA